MMEKQVYFVTGIDTDAGKSYVTGFLAREMMDRGLNVITQKFVQTGNRDYSEDIEVHRRIMRIPMQPRDIDHTTAPIILSYPASADLAARIDGVTLDLNVAAKATETLLKEYDVVLVEGAGGLMVPLKGEYMAIDYVLEHRLPVVLVTNGRLGSINHTLLTLDAMAHRGIEVAMVAYNSYFDKDPVICEDTKQYIRGYLQNHHPTAVFKVF